MSMNHGRRWLTGVMAIALMLGACATNPVTGKSEITLMSPEQELQVGKRADQQISSQYGVYDDAKLNQYVSQLGQKIARQSEQPDLTWHFKVLDSPVVNAFALPGGYIYVTRGLLAHVENEAQLAVVLGHEIGHVTARHIARRFTRGQLTQLLVGLGALFFEQIRPFLGAIDVGLQLLFLQYSRDDERDADKLGVRYALAAGYQTREGAAFFRVLDRVQALRKENHLPSWAKTHPEPGEREVAIVRLSNQLQEQMAVKSLTGTEPVGYLPKVDGLVFGDNPRQGVVRGNVFYHPEMAFQFPVPANWQVTNLPAQVVMRPKLRAPQAQILFQLVPGATPWEAASTFVQANRLQVVEKQTATIHGLPAYRVVSRVTAQGQQGSISLRVLSTFIQKGDRVFAFHGVSPAPVFGSFAPTFLSVANGFARVTDPAILQIQPRRIQVEVAPKTLPLSSLIQPVPPGVAPQEVAILNQRELGEQIYAGTLIKEVR